MERDPGLARIPSNIHAPIPWVVISCMQHCLGLQQISLQLSADLGKLGKAEEKKPKPQNNCQKETESSKTPNPVKGERQLRFSLKAFLKQL